MKKYVALFAVISVVALSGCSAENINDKGYALVKQYLLSDNDQYNEYLSKKEINEENIDADGYYIDSEITQLELSHTGIVHVSFASNSLLNVTYYADKEHKEAIDKDNCYLDPGETIYAVVDQTSLTQSNTYAFQGFSMVAFDGDQAIFDYARFDNEEITIPADIQYREVSIIPDGAYQKRDLTFSAEYKDVDGNIIPIQSTWLISVGNQRFRTTYDNYSVESNNALRVGVQYDPETFYPIEEESEPKYERIAKEDWITYVYYPQYSANEAINDYKIVFGKMYDFTISSIISEPVDAKVDILVNGEKVVESSDANELSYTGYARIKSDIEIKSTGKIQKVNFTNNLQRISNSGFNYVLIDETKGIDFDPKEYNYSHGTVLFYDKNDNPILDKTNIVIGDELHYKGTPEDGYTFNMGDKKQTIVVNSDVSYLLKNELKFMPKQTITLNQPKKGGTIVYYLNGKKVNTKEIAFSEGSDELTVDFIPDERYMVNNLSDNAECIVSASNHLIKFKNNDGEEVEIDNVFMLSSTQKADLTVKLDDTVGTEIKFNVYNGTNESINDKKSYVSKEFFDSWGNPLGLDDNELLKDEKIETVSGIKISVSDWSPLKNEAIRLDVTKTDSSKEKTNETYYILSGSGSQFITTNSGKSSYYTDIDINISKVKGSTFIAQDYTYDNGEVEITFKDVSNKASLKNGDFVDDTREIRITLTSKENYQVYQKSTNPFSSSYSVVEKYETTCKYSDLDEKFAEMRSKTKISH